MPVFEQRVDNIVGIAYAMDLLDYAQKVGQFLLLFLLLCVSIAFLLIYATIS